MASIATNVIWGSSPNIYFNFSYEKQRDGSTQQYKIKVECKPLTGGSYFGYPIYLEISVNGSVAATKTLKTADPSQWSSAITYTTGWVNVANKTTGTTPLKIRIYSGSGSSRDTSYNYNLATDPAASLIAATDANIESVSTVTFTRYNTAFTHTLSYKAAGKSAYTTIFTKQNVASYGWTVPEALYAVIPNDPSVEVTLLCQTYNGTTLVGENTCKMTATADKSKCAPDVTVEALDCNEYTRALTGNPNNLIRYHSDLFVTASATPKNEADIAQIRVYNGTEYYYKNNATALEYTFKKVEVVSPSAYAIDTRDYDDTEPKTGLTLIPYIKLTNNATAKRTSPTGDEVVISTKGNYFNGSFGAVNNTLRVQVRYKPTTQEQFEDTDAWTEMSVTIDGDTYTAEVTLTGFDYKQTYDISVRAQDEIYKHEGPIADAVQFNLILNKGVPIYDFGEEDFNFNVPITRSYEAYGMERTLKLCYEPGDTGEHAINTTYAGIITDSAKKLCFFIPLTKPVVAEYVSVEGTVIVYGANGLLNGGNQISLSGSGGNYTVFQSFHENGIRVTIFFNSAITNATNNTAVTVVSSGDLTFRFE